MGRLRLLTKLKLAAASILFLAAGAAWLYGQHNIEWSARVAWGEARGEPEGGMQAVLNVMANRKKDPRFPNSLSGVARQPCQFSSLNAGNPNKKKLEAVKEPDPQYKRAVRLAALAQVGLLWDITGGATYYHSDDIDRPAYLADAEVTAVIGSHVFYKEANRAD